MMGKCSLCSKEVGDLDLTDGICDRCRKEHALSEHTPPLRPRTPCARCSHPQFVRGLAVRERAATGGNHAEEYVAPLSVTYVDESHHTTFRGRKMTTIDKRRRCS